jgi:spore maturation protein CgeB
VARRILLIDNYYPPVLGDLGVDELIQVSETYSSALNRVLDYGFGTAGAYLRVLADLGWEANAVIPNALGLQDLWAREHGVRRPWRRAWQYGAYLARLPVANAFLHRFPHLHGTLLEQIKAFAPDVVVVQDINLVSPALARAIRKHTGLLIGEIASPLPPKAFLKSYDLIVSALPSIVETVRKLGIPSAALPLGFDDRWATSTPASSRPIDAIFVGSFSRLQPQTAPLLNEISKRVPGLQIYGPASSRVLADAGLTEFYHGQAWGGRMFELLGQSKIVINRHGSIAGKYSVNMRMYEATGAGAVLLTEQKDHLSESFSPGIEVLTYTDPIDAADRAASALNDPPLLDRVARAGQVRTLREHTYRERAKTLIAAIDERLARDQTDADPST